MKTLTLIVLGLTSILHAQSPLMQWRFDADVSSGKADKMNKVGEIDDRNVTLAMKATITNLDTKKSLEGGKVTLIAIAKDVVMSEELKVVSRSQFPLTIKPLGKQSVSAEPVLLKYDDKASAKHGHKYLGYVLMIDDAEGKRVFSKAVPTTLGGNLDAAMKLTQDQICNRKLEPINSRNPMNRRSSY